MFKDTKFNKEVYQVRYTGKKIRKAAKAYTDFNGYEIEQEASSRKQIGMYKNDILVYTVSGDGRIWKGSECYGKITLTENY